MLVEVGRAVANATLGLGGDARVGRGGALGDGLLERLVDPRDEAAGDTHGSEGVNPRARRALGDRGTNGLNDAFPMDHAAGIGGERGLARQLGEP